VKIIHKKANSKAKNMKKTVKKIQKFKLENKKIAALTAYDYPTAKFLDMAGIDIILVGDSLANVVLGYDSTTKVSMNEMEIFTQAVSRGVKEALIVGDMPFLSYNVSFEEAVQNAGRFIKAGADAVKIEGGSEYIINLVKRLTETGIPVMAHLGFTPQYINTIGGNLIQGKDFDTTLKILEAAKKLEEAGAFSIVLEMVPKESAKYISENLKIPTIGIGAGMDCDGQILVINDITGKFDDYSPKFARKYFDSKEMIIKSAKQYIEDVTTGNFPNEAESFSLKEEELIKLENHKQCR